MGWRGTAALAVALLGAAYLLYREVSEQGGDGSWRSVLELPRPTPPADQISRLLEFDPATVKAIHVRHGGRDWSARKQGGGWQDVRRQADVDDFIAALQDLAEVMPLEVPAADLDDHGLDPPASTVEIERSDGPPLLLLVGRRNPPSTGVYVQVGRNGPVALTGALLLWELDKATRALANHEATKE